MEWSHFFLNKVDWQRKTFEMIKKDLISARDNHFVKYDCAEENHLVMIYGKSQVGKTTLILNMIGIKTECFFEVYETLRAGVPRGNSSTSTAIIYTKSSNGLYGCALSSINDVSLKDIDYYDKKGMIDHLEKIREQVENNRIPTNIIMFLYIPKNYFVQDSSTDSISIMDMPGIESRNHKEYIHVQDLMTTYIPICSVCIIACRSNDIQSLESIVLPNHLEWKNMEHRFVLVITHAYNDGTIKQYFRTSPSKREGKFYDYVIASYTQEIRKILGKNNRTEVFPVDVGDTLTRLCDNEIESEIDRVEIIETKNHVLDNLRKSIISHKGERLKSALIDLEVIINDYGEDELQRIIEEISVIDSKIKDKEILIESASDNIRELIDEELEELQSEIVKNEELFKKIPKQDCVTNLPKIIRKYIFENHLFWKINEEYYLNDIEKAVFAFLRKNVSKSVQDFIQELNRLKGQVGDECVFDCAKILTEVDSFILKEYDSFYPPIRRLFAIRERVLLKSIMTKCNYIQSSINIHLYNYVDVCESDIKKIISEKQQKANRINVAIMRYRNKKMRYKSEIELLNTKMKRLQDEKEEIEQRKKQDKKTLTMYLQYAEQAYLKQRNDVIHHINTSSCSKDKLLLFIFLGLLDKDYQKVTGGVYELLLTPSVVSV